MITHPTFNNIVATTGGTTAAAAATTEIYAPAAGKTGRLGVYVTNTGASNELWVEIYPTAKTATLTNVLATLVVPIKSSLFVPMGAAMGLAVASPAAGTTTYTVTQVLQ